MGQELTRPTKKETMRGRKLARTAQLEEAIRTEREDLARHLDFLRSREKELGLPVAWDGNAYPDVETVLAGAFGPDGLLDLIAGRWYGWFGHQGLTTYPQGLPHQDQHTADLQQRLHDACLALEGQGKIKRQQDEPDRVFWVAVTESGAGELDVNLGERRLRRLKAAAAQLEVSPQELIVRLVDQGLADKRGLIPG